MSGRSMSIRGNGKSYRRERSTGKAGGIINGHDEQRECIRGDCLVIMNAPVLQGERDDVLHNKLLSPQSDLCDGATATPVEVVASARPLFTCHVILKSTVPVHVKRKAEKKRGGLRRYFCRYGV